MVANSLFITGAGKPEKKNLDLDQGNWWQHNGTEKRTPEQRYIHIEKGYISRAKVRRKSCQGDTQNGSRAKARRKSCQGDTQTEVVLKHAESCVKAIRKTEVVPKHAESRDKATRKRKANKSRVTIACKLSRLK